MSKNNILVLLPCLNESAALGRTILRVQQEITSARIVVIDNGSTDDSVEVAKGLNVQVVHQPLKGKGNAFRTGLNFLEKEDLAVLMIDSDDSYGLENVHVAIGAIEERGYDMVVGFGRTIQVGSCPWEQSPFHSWTNFASSWNRRHIERLENFLS